MYQITLNFLRFLSRLFSFPSQYAPCIPAFRSPGKKEKGVVTAFTDGNNSSDPGDPELEFHFEDGYEIINLKDPQTLANELRRALVELSLKKGEVRFLDDKERRGQEELAEATQKLASVTEYLESLAEGVEERKDEFTTTIGRLQEENRELAQRLQEQTGRVDSLMAELAGVKGVAATREKDIEVLRARLNTALSTVESQSADLTSIRTRLPKPDSVVDTDAIKLVGRLNAEIFQAAALLAEACSSVQSRPLPDLDNRTASTRVKEMFSAKFVDLVQDVPHENNPAVLRIAFQACIVVFADWISAAWHFQADPSPQFFGEVYRNVWLDGA
jgi:cell division septum initiation protein DivIVA